MKTLSTTFKVLTCAIFITAFSSLAQAQATRTWVSGVGSDANPCSRTAPCKTFAGAISKTAKDGEINALDPGGYGTLTITKSITVDGNGTHASVLASLTTGFIVNITDAADVRKTVIIRNISINGAATGVHGINFIAGLKLYVESVQIFGFQSAASSRGIKANKTSAGQLYVKDTVISNCASGIDASTTSGVLLTAIDHVRIEGMTDGLIFGTGTGNNVRDSFIVGNSGVGVKTSVNAGTILERTMIDSNGTGLQPGAG
ncbi:MAG: hypothetical protein QOH25_1615, partial [Acidobacteriota bacterium]|nr:hypothetical protein [Acidobacteriota bacterium]